MSAASVHPAMGEERVISSGVNTDEPTEPNTSNQNESNECYLMTYTTGTNVKVRSRWVEGVESEDSSKFNKQVILVLQQVKEIKPTIRHGWADEAKFEQWMDDAARIQVANRVSSYLFSEVISRLILEDDVVSDLWKKCYECSVMIEEQINTFARLMYPDSYYLKYLERELMQEDTDKMSVVEARTWTVKGLTRYWRLCIRWDQTPMYLWNHAKWIMMGKLDSVVLRKLYTWPHIDLYKIGFVEICSVAMRIERSLANTTMDALTLDSVRVERTIGRQNRVQTLKTYPVEHTGRNLGGDTFRRTDKRPRGACHCCGEEGHFRYNCPVKMRKCDGCGRRGHTIKKCTTTKIVDSSGRPLVTTTNRRGGVDITLRQDASRNDRLLTAATTIRDVRDAISRPRKVKKPIAVRENHGTEVVEAVEVPEEEEYVQMCLEDAENANRELEMNYLDVEMYMISIFHPVLNTSISALIDTGASISVFNKISANKLGLKGSGRFITLKGVGAVKAEVCEEIDLIVNKRCITMKPVRVDNNMTNLIGRPDLHKAGIGITFHVKEINSLEEIMNFEEFITLEEKKSQTTKDTITQSSLDDNIKILYKKVEHLSKDKRIEVTELFLKYIDVWGEPRSGKMKCPPANFTVKGNPIRMRQRPLAPELVKEFKKQVDDMLAKGVLVSSKSEWCSVPVFVKKKDGGWRMALDYRRLNNQMVFDSYPLPNLWDMLQSLIGYEMYTCLDANWGFWNLPVGEESRKYTAITTPWGLYEFTVLPFGIKNSPGEFQRAMDHCLRDVSNFTKVYIDDMSFGDHEWNEHMSHLEKVLDCCRRNGIYLKLSKVELCKSKVKLLGHIVSKEGISPDPKKVQALKSAKRPCNVKELRSFLGAMNFLGRYSNFQQVAAPLTDLLKKGIQWNWNEVHENSFKEVKELASENTLLERFNSDLPLLLMSDASNNGCGALLFQMKEKQIKPISWYARKFSYAEQRYDTREKELLGVKNALEYFNQYTKHHHTIVYTDHESLRWMRNSQSGRVQRWSLSLMQYSITLYYVPGPGNVVADWLSRSEYDDYLDSDIDRIAVPIWVVEKLDPDGNDKWKPILGFPVMLPTIAELGKATELEGVEESGFKVYKDSEGIVREVNSRAIYIPSSLREVFLYYFHVGPYGSHRGVRAMTRRMKKFICWPKMQKSCGDYVNACPCKRYEGHRGSRRYLRNVLDRPRPQELVSMDWVGPRTLNKEVVHIAVIVDHATRYMLAMSYKGPTATNTVNVLDHYVGIFGVPRGILTDRGAAFTSGVFEKYVREKLGTTLMRTSVAYPQGNGINESSHQVLNHAMKACNWKSPGLSAEQFLREIVLTYNATPHSLTGQSPYFLQFGCEPVLPGFLDYMNHTKQNEKTNNSQRNRTMLHVRNMLQWSEMRRVSHDGKEVVSDISLGDWVRFPLTEWMRQKERKQNVSSNRNLLKEQAVWSLPAKVVGIDDNVLSVIELGVGDNRKAVRQVSKSIARRLSTDVPGTLIPLVIQDIIMECSRKGTKGDSVIMDFGEQVIGGSKPLDTVVKQAVKRSRLE